uniref:Uncharacterized protein n=1 Tax=Romanomermis culicivorax TaxID=13658 RepID=A0A915I848_ROMCU
MRIIQGRDTNSDRKCLGRLLGFWSSTDGLKKGPWLFITTLQSFSEKNIEINHVCGTHYYMYITLPSRAAKSRSVPSCLRWRAWTVVKSRPKSSIISTRAKV